MKATSTNLWDAPEKEVSSAKHAGYEADSARSRHLGKLRLLTALDALLVAGSVRGAALQLGLSTPAMSRLLGQIRAEIGDPIFVRTGRQMVPTPRAEAMRLSLRHLSADVERLLDGGEDATFQGHNEHHHHISRRFPNRAPPLAIRPSVLLDGQPTPVEFAQGLAELANAADPRRRLARYIALIGRGIGQSRPLTIEEAEDAFDIILCGQADPLQIGGFLLLLHFRRETAPELAGLIKAARHYGGAAPLSGKDVDLDWPAYLPRQSLRSPWFLQAARLVANAGHGVLLHGPTSDTANGLVEIGLQKLGIPKSTSLAEARSHLRSGGIAFAPLNSFAPQIQHLLELYPLFESRTPVHSTVHMLNPLGAGATLTGVARVAYHGMHRDAAQLLQWPSISILASARDVAEFNPFRTAKVYRSIAGQSDELILPTVGEMNSPQRSIYSVIEHWEAVWTGAERDARAQAIVTSTTAVALMTIRKQGVQMYPAALEEARALWTKRLHS